MTNVGIEIQKAIWYSNHHTNHHVCHYGSHRVDWKVAGHFMNHHFINRLLNDVNIVIQCILIVYCYLVLFKQLNLYINLYNQHFNGMWFDFLYFHLRYHFSTYGNKQLNICLYLVCIQPIFQRDVVWFYIYPFEILFFLLKFANKNIFVVTIFYNKTYGIIL